MNMGFCIAGGLRIAVVAGLAVIGSPAGWAADISNSAAAASNAAPDLTSVRSRIKAKDYKGALAELQPMLANSTSADVFNLAGFASRKSGDRAQGFAYYRKALEIDRNHLGALEYQGELFAETGQIDKARENADRLQRLCPGGCEQLTDLREAIAAATKAR